MAIYYRVETDDGKKVGTLAGLWTREALWEAGYKLTKVGRKNFLEALKNGWVTGLVAIRTAGSKGNGKGTWSGNGWTISQERSKRYGTERIEVEVSEGSADLPSFHVNHPDRLTHYSRAGLPSGKSYAGDSERVHEVVRREEALVEYWGPRKKWNRKPQARRIRKGNLSVVVPR